MMIKDIKGVVILLSFALATAFLFNHLSPFGIALFGQWETSEGVINANSKQHSVNSSLEIVNPAAVKQIVENKERIILDVRSFETYGEGHIPGALSFPLADFDEIIPKIFASLQRSDAILVYCSSIECSDSHTFASRLSELRYENVKVFPGGFRQWQEKGYGVEKNEE